MLESSLTVSLRKPFGRRRGATEGGPPPAVGMRLGVNFSGAGTSNAYYPFINVMWNAGPWIPRNTNTGTYTVNNKGELIASNPNDFFMCHISDGGEGLFQGRYTVENPNLCKIGVGAFTEWVNPRYTAAEPDDVGGYFQTNNFQFDWPGQQPPSTGMFFIVQGSCTGVNMIAPGQYANWLAGEIFHPSYETFQNTLGPVSPVRTMIWTGTNGNTETDWADRIQPDAQTAYHCKERVQPWERVAGSPPT
jgi:hypothetical protein